jgi:hypothetical protein
VELAPGTAGLEPPGNLRLIAEVEPGDQLDLDGEIACPVIAEIRLEVTVRLRAR